MLFINEERKGENHIQSAGIIADGVLALTAVWRKMRVVIADEGLRIEGGGENQDAKEGEFFVSWYRWHWGGIKLKKSLNVYEMGWSSLA